MYTKLINKVKTSSFNIESLPKKKFPMVTLTVRRTVYVIHI